MPLNDYLKFVAVNYYGGGEDGCAQPEVGVFTTLLCAALQLTLCTVNVQFQVFRKAVLGRLVSPLRRPQVVGTLASVSDRHSNAWVGGCRLSCSPAVACVAWRHRRQVGSARDSSL